MRYGWRFGGTWVAHGDARVRRRFHVDSWSAAHAEADEYIGGIAVGSTDGSVALWAVHLAPDGYI